jgi:SM-20-related protein
MYKVAALKYPYVDSELPAPVDMRFPVFRTNIAGAFAGSQLRRMQAQQSTAELALTTIVQGGVAVTGTNTTTRNAYILPQSVILPEAEAELAGVAKLAWRNFEYHAANPQPGVWQPLMYRPGGFFVSHWDDSRGALHNGKNYMFRDRPERSMTVLLYLNDDYEGGAIVFPNLLDTEGKPYRVQPKAGDVVAFPSHEMFAHQVEAVTSGTRFVLSRWYDDTEWFKSYGALNGSLRTGVRQALETVRFGHASNKTQDTIKFFSSVFVPDPTQDTVDLQLDQTAALTQPGVRAVWDALRNSAICHEHALLRCYANVQTYGLDSEPHKDADNRNNFTTLIYAVDKWEPRWGGETLLFRSGRDQAVPVVPWNIIQFRGDMLHVAKAPTRYCLDARRTLMFKTRRVYELDPKDRPPHLL